MLRYLTLFPRLIWQFLHPDQPGGMNGVKYALICAILLAVFASQSLGVDHQLGLVSSSRAAPTAPGPADGGNGTLYPAPRVLRTAALASYGWYVHGVRLTTGQDVSNLLNYWGDYYHVWPVGLAATAGVESGLNPFAERWAGGLDNSCGLLQQIVTNVAAYTGIQDPRAACNWEENPANSIYLAARIYAGDFAYQHNCVQWPQAYGMYNAGAGYSCAYYYDPAGDVAAHMQVFLGWYSYAQATWMGGGPPLPPAPPKKPGFPARKWRAFTSAVPPFENGHTLRWEAKAWWKGHVRTAHGVVSPPQWFGPVKGRRIGYMTERFQDERYYYWPTRRGWQKWIRVHHIGR